ncbi:hypothetical protein EZS27_001301 [termite gut metagenome]|uniref:Uncharacterized protein n=1 Tax=termite gut metagenome TaxID=433724 RepID=A0A5J4SZI2_9ZZZZ
MKRISFFLIISLLCITSYAQQALWGGQEIMALLIKYS